MSRENKIQFSKMKFKIRWVFYRKKPNREQSLLMGIRWEMVLLNYRKVTLRHLIMISTILNPILVWSSSLVTTF